MVNEDGSGSGKRLKAVQGTGVLSEREDSGSSRSSCLSESLAELGHGEKDDPVNSLQEVSSQSPRGNIPPLSPRNPDPNRIPSSIFASKPANPGEWSVTSNESLFSIHIGNNSFSKDSAFLLYKSGELLRPDEMCNFPSPRLHPVTEAEKNMDVPKQPLAESATIRSEKAVPSEHEPGKYTTHPEKIRQAEELRNSFSSIQSFQFPVLESHMAADASVTVTMMKKPSSKKQLPEEPPEEPPAQTPETTPKAAGNSWFSCFSCCSLGR